MSGVETGRAAGTRLGPYEILGRIAAGGMGEVYRARDPRLARDVALKVLSDQFAADRQRLQRFEREARVVSALNHPNIVTVFEIGQSETLPFIAMELVEGQSLRQLLRAGGLPLRKLLDLATQIAEGLARAHEAGVVHRDLKPDNVMVTPDGGVKILDFGLAKLTRSFLERGAEPEDGTLPLPTEPGVLIGTVRYMAPEQASGQAADFRSDQFSFGSVLYEMATGEPAFRRDTTVDTLSAILHEEPRPLSVAAPKLPVPVRWVIERCLAKDPADRYAATRDLARDLASLREHISDVSVPGARARAPRSADRAKTWSMALGAVILGVAIGAVAIRFRRPPAEPPRFRQLTFRSGAVTNAFFSPDGATVMYTATWEGKPLAIYAQRLGSSESRIFREDASLFGVSPAGEMALSLGIHGVEPWIDAGTLARAEMTSGAAPRIVMEDVQWATWAPNGRDLAAIREVSGRSTLEYPIGRVVYRAAGGFLSHPAVSPDGARVAVLEHPVRADDAGNVVIVDSAGGARTLVTGLLSAFGLRWSPSGDEIWFTGSDRGSSRELQAVGLSGHRRTLVRVFGSMLLDDVSPSGRALVTHDVRKERLFALAPGASEERELSWLDYSLGRALSSDGRSVLFVEGGEGAGETYAAFHRGTDGSPAVRLGDGDPQALSPDGRWAAVIAPRDGIRRLVLYPIGAGQERLLPPSRLDVQRADWLPDGTALLLTASEAGAGTRVYVQPLAGSPRPVSGENFSALPATISPDGSRVVVRAGDRSLWLLPVAGGEPTPIKAPAAASIWGWTEDGERLYISLPGGSNVPASVPPGPRRVDVLSVATGEIRPWKTIGGRNGANAIRIANDGRSYIYSFVETQGDLYVLDGLR